MNNARGEEMITSEKKGEGGHGTRQRNEGESRNLSEVRTDP